MTPALLYNCLFLQVLYVFAMFLIEHCSLRGLYGLGLTDGFGTGSLSLLN